MQLNADYNNRHMTKISLDEVKKLASLARIAISEDEAVKFQAEITEILHYVSQLNEIDTEGVEPTAQVTGLENVTRKDELIDYPTTPQELVSLAPKHKDNSVVVKKVL